jgi:hypothetical protein
MPQHSTAERTIDLNGRTSSGTTNEQLAQLLDDVMSFSGWTTTRMSEWIDMMASLDARGPSGSRSLPGRDLFQIVLAGPSDAESCRLASRVFSSIGKVNSKAIKQIGRPLVSMIFAED